MTRGDELASEGTGTRVQFKEQRAFAAESHLLRAREAAGVAAQAQDAEESSAALKIAEAWLDLAGRALHDVLEEEMKARAANESTD